MRPFLIALSIALLSSCVAYTLPDLPDVPAGSYSELPPDVGTTRHACRTRVNIAADTSNEGRQHAALWQLILGAIGGLSTAAGILFAVRYARPNSGAAPKSTVPPIIAAIFSAAAAILAPFVVTREKADKMSAEYESLRTLLEKGDDEPKVPDRIKLYRDCAEAHSDYLTPVSHSD